MPGYGGADTSGGARGNSGSAGAFTGGGLPTGKTWYGTKAHFTNGTLDGYSTKGANFRTPTGGVIGNPRPTGTSQPSMPVPPPNYVPPVVPPYVPPYVPPVMPPVVTAPLPPPTMPPAMPPAQPPYQVPRYGPWPGQSAIPPNGPVYNQQRVTQAPKTNFGGGFPGYGGFNRGDGGYGR